MTVPDAAIWDGSQWRSIIPDPPIVPDPGLQQTVVALTPATGWENYGSNHHPATAVMTGRHVSIHGVLRVAAASVAANGTVLTVPASMRPIGTVVAEAMVEGATHARFDIKTTGEVVMVSPASLTQYTWVAITFNYTAVP